MIHISKISHLLNKLSLVLSLLIVINHYGLAQNLNKVMDLNERWKFTIGDSQEWANPDFDDSDWEWIDVPSAWENQGFHGYDGYAWYRKTFHKRQLPNNQSLYLQLGNIDDVDEVFFNGKRIGKTGNFPPKYATAYNAHRAYHVPASLIQETNTIAVRVYDDVGEGGITHGDISLFMDRDAIPVEVDLSGTWKFKLGAYAHEDISKINDWDSIVVPGNWENQGYKDYDGYACYVLEFNLEQKFLKDRMVLALGKIDDIDQVFVNGVLVGQSGAFVPKTVRERSDSWQQVRAYYLPVNLLKANTKNTIVVRVYDAMKGGGIYTGSIGLISQEHYIQYWKKRRNKY
ncbi:beta galactosidase jelly roll domain-containing protein [Marinifilum sp.]|uniref:beta galactosidase jelly roll domain-containing protein n=1 Tax=Marinifilum sp. TaxID=2033137 RepID=UPI003BACB7E9